MKSKTIPPRSLRSYSFLQPLSTDAYGARTSLFEDLLSSRAFRRLEMIRFLGGIDYVLIRSPNGSARNVRYTRRQHSLGVARLALQYAARMELTTRDARTLFVSALLHDIGHAPLSHSLEPVFQEVFGLTHHIATENIICGRVEIGRELYAILRSHSIDIDRVLGLIAGQDSSFGRFFDGPINFDTIEGICRSKMYMAHFTTPLNPGSILDAAISRAGEGDCDIVDGFWNRKNEVYKYIVNSTKGVLADYACQLFMRRNIHNITDADYYITEDVMFRKLPGLNQLMTSSSFEFDLWRQVTEPIKYTARLFFVDEKYNFFGREDDKRYKQIRQVGLLEPRVVSPERIELTKDLFNDHRIPAGEDFFGREATVIKS